MRLGLLLILGLSVAMCGQKGPLLLPEKSAVKALVKTGVSQLPEPVLVA